MADGGEFEAAMDLLRSTGEELRREAPNLSRAKELFTEVDRLGVWHESMSSGAWGAAESKAARYASFNIQRGRPSPHRHPKIKPPDKSGSVAPGDADEF